MSNNKNPFELGLLKMANLGKIAIYCMTVCMCNLAYSGTPPLPKNIIDQLPKGYSLMAVQAGDLNNDKLTDYVVVVHKDNEEEISRRTGKAHRRPLLVFTQRPDNTFSLLARNDHVVYAIDEGGQCDPFMDSGDGITIKGAYFTVENGVACGAHWSDYITFKYSESLKNLVFHKQIHENWVLNSSQDPSADALVLGNRKVTTNKQSAPVLLKDYKPK